MPVVQTFFLARSPFTNKQWEHFEEEELPKSTEGCLVLKVHFAGLRIKMKNFPTVSNKTRACWGHDPKAAMNSKVFHSVFWDSFIDMQMIFKSTKKVFIAINFTT